MLLLMLVFISLVYFHNNYRFWTHISTAGFSDLTDYRSLNIVGLHGTQILIHKKFVDHLDRVEGYAKQKGIILVVNNSYRYNGQLKTGIVKPAKMSNHLSGFAIDFNLMYLGKKYLSHDLRKANLVNLPTALQEFIQAVRKDNKLRWGGDFKKEDPVHIDFPLNITDAKRWKSYSKGSYEDYVKAVPRWKIWKTDRAMIDL